MFRQSKEAGHRYMYVVPTTSIITDSASLQETFDRMLFGLAESVAMPTYKTVQFR